MEYKHEVIFCVVNAGFSETVMDAAKAAGAGGGTVIVWDYIPLVGGQTLGAATGLYSLAVGFLLGIVVIVAVSLCTKAPAKEITETFDNVNSSVKASRKA